MFAKRDVFALLMSCFAVYYSTLSEGVVSFRPAFVVARDGVPGETAWDRRDPRGGVFASGDVYEGGFARGAFSGDGQSSC